MIKILAHTNISGQLDNWAIDCSVGQIFFPLVQFGPAFIALIYFDIYAWETWAWAWHDMGDW